MTMALHSPTPTTAALANVGPRAVGPGPAIPGFNFDKFIPAKEAAGLLQIDHDHLSRLCRTKLEAQGLALCAVPPEGGQARWYIRRDYDARLIGGPIAKLHQLPALDGFSKRQRDGAMMRRSCVEAFRRFKSASGVVGLWIDDFIEQLRNDFPALKISRSTLYDWDRLYRRPADLDKLIDLRGCQRRSADSDDAWCYFKDLYLHENAPALVTCWKAVADVASDHDWQWGSLDNCYKQLDRRIAPELQLRNRQPSAWKKTLRPFIPQDPEAWPANECWIGDHKLLDVWCSWRSTIVRPWLTTWMDWRTRKVTGWVLSENPDSHKIRAALRHGLTDESNFGGPAHVWIDNGKDYDSYTFHGQTKRERHAKIKAPLDEPNAKGLFGLLNIEPHFSIPFNPNGKGRLERWFRTLGEFCKLFETYTGHNHETKPDRLKEILKRPALIPSFESLRERIEKSIAGYNEEADHARDDMIDGGRRFSPAEALEHWTPSRRVMADPEALELLLQHWEKPVTVGRNGISLTIRGRSLTYGRCAACLMPYRAATKERRPILHVSYDPHDLRSVRVYDASFRAVGTVEMNQLGGNHSGDPIAVEHLAELKKEDARYARSLKNVSELSITSVLSPGERLIEQAAKSREASEPKPPPPSLQIVTTKLDGQAREIKREELRIAVGAESRSRGPSAMDKLRARTAEHRPADPAPAYEPPADPWAKMRRHK